MEKCFRQKLNVINEMSKNLYYILFLVVVSCTTTTVSEPDHIVNVVGEIFPDLEVDDPDFQICHPQKSTVQYYAFGQKTYTGEKVAIEHYFREHFVPEQSNESGLIRIRFVVNCQGETGRFRLLAMNTDYSPKEFSSTISTQLLQLTKNLKGWKAMKGRETYRDYYQYLIFKIENGNLIEILP